MLKIVAGLLTLCISLPLYAQTDKDTLWYEIEIIIFEHHQQPDKMSEIWPADPGTPDYSRSQLLLPSPIEIETVEAEITEQLLLDSEISRIFIGNPEQWDTGDFDSAPYITPDLLTSDSGGNIFPPIDFLKGALKSSLTRTTTFEIPDTDTNDEMIAFQNNSSFTSPQIQQSGLTVNLVEPRPDEIIAFQMLKEKELLLIEDYRRLLKSEHYTPRMHFGWRQPVTSDRKSQPVLIYRDMLEQDAIYMEETGEAVLEESDINVSEPTGVLNNQSSTSQSEPFRNGNIEGTIRISSGRYLHIQTDLLYFNQSRPPRAGFSFFGALKKDITPDVYRIKQSRRVKANEVHYFDHPMFGVLTVIRPYELPRTEEDEDAPLNFE